jgi:transposase
MILDPIGEAVKGELFHANCLQVDETPIAYLSPGHGSTKQGYLWVYLDPVAGTVLYDWQLGRGHDCLLDILGFDEETGTTRFQGALQCDGFSAYPALVSRYGGITLAGCLAHIRRKFFDARAQSPEVTLRILEAIAGLYRIEAQLRAGNAPPDCRMLVRLARSRPIVEELGETIVREKPFHLPRSRLGEAIGYALGQWDKFRAYLHDGKLEIDNNLVENAIRPTKLGMKNWLFFGSAEAGEHNALLYTLIGNCKVHGLDPELYLAEVIERLPARPTSQQAAELTPASIAARQRRADEVA